MLAVVVVGFGAVAVVVFGLTVVFGPVAFGVVVACGLPCGAAGPFDFCPAYAGAIISDPIARAPRNTLGMRMVLRGRWAQAVCQQGCSAECETYGDANVPGRDSMVVHTLFLS